MQHLSEEELNGLRAILDAERASLEEELAEHGRKVGDDWQGTTAGFDAPESDQIDTADRLEELSINVPLVEELEKRYREIRVALQKMDAGKYGIDENTGEAIDVERLRANPAARTNI